MQTWCERHVCLGGRVKPGHDGGGVGLREKRTDGHEPSYVCSEGIHPLRQLGLARPPHGKRDDA
jgi:hypothetical protein